MASASEAESGSGEQMPKMLSILRSTENTPPIRTRPQPLPPLVAQLPSRCVPQVPCVLVYPHHEKVMAEGDPSLGKLQIQTCKAPPKLSAVESFGATCSTSHLSGVWPLWSCYRTVFLVLIKSLSWVLLEDARWAAVTRNKAARNLSRGLAEDAPVF